MGFEFQNANAHVGVTLDHGGADAYNLFVMMDLLGLDLLGLDRIKRNVVMNLHDWKIRW